MNDQIHHVADGERRSNPAVDGTQRTTVKLEDQLKMTFPFGIYTPLCVR